MVDQPFLLTGDYFRTRDQERSTKHEVAVPGFGAEEAAAQQAQAAKSGQEAAEVARAELEAAAGQSQGPAEQPASMGGIPLKVGLLLDEGGLSLKDGRRLMETARRAAEARGLLLVEDPELREVLAPTDCLENKDLQCIADTVSLYPGVRQLLLAESLTLPGSYPGEAAMRINVVDTGLSYRYPVLEMVQSVRSEAEAEAFLGQAVERSLAYAADKAETMPSHCRVFSVTGNRVFISAGQRSGLELGRILPVASGGETVSSPTGIPIDWIPGEITGALRVERFVGRDAAACTVSQGQKPEQGDYVLLEKAE